MLPVALLVEGNLDEAVGRRLLAHAGLEVSIVYGKHGIDYIRKKLSGFNSAAASLPIVVLADLMDTRSDCPAVVVQSWLPDRHPRLLFRLVVREMESWLLADRANLAKFLHVAVDKVPAGPEDLPDPKRELIQLARRSRNSSTRRLLVPAAESTAREGPGYTSEMQRFVREGWNVETAAQGAVSLRRCLRALERLRSGKA